MEQAQATHPASVEPTVTAATGTVQLPQAVVSAPVTHMVHPDVWMIEKAHDSFWGTQWPPTAALLGVFLTIAVKWIWDARDRKYKMKRKIYLQLADGITEVVGVLAAFTEANTPLDEIKKRFVKAFAVISRAEVVANDKLLSALSDLSDSGGAAFMELLRARVALEKHGADIRTNDPFIRQSQAQIDSVLAEQTRMNIDNVKNPEHFERLTQQFNFLAEQLAKYTTSTNFAFDGINAAVANISEILLARQIELLPLTERVKEIMRKDLGFRYDYQHQLARKLKTAEKVRAEFLVTQAAVKKAFTPNSMKDRQE